MPLHATFMVTGEVATASGRADGDEMDVDAPSTAIGSTSLSCVIVDESNLEDVKASFSSLRSCHIYSLSLSAQTVSGNNKTNVSVRDLDSTSKFDELRKLGKVLGSSVTGPRKAVKRIDEKPLQPTPSSSKLIGKDTPKPVVPEPVQKVSPLAKEKPKATGKLDWSNAKVKGASSSKPSPTPAKEEAKKPAEKATKSFFKKETIAKERISSLPDLKGKYKESGTKDVKKEPSPVPVKGPSARVKKGAIVSDDDEDDDVKPRKNRLRKRLSSVELEASDSEADKSLRAMMDIDDSEVIRVSKSNATAIPKSEDPPESDSATQDTEEPSQLVDTPMDEDSDPAPKVKPRKRKEKKVVPVGRNGLKKKRILKSRSMTDAKGYWATEDYSSYESVDEEEDDSAKDKPSNSKANAKEPAKPVKKGPAVKSQREPERSAPSKGTKQSGDLKRKASAGGNQKSLMNFFANK